MKAIQGLGQGIEPFAAEVLQRWSFQLAWLLIYALMFVTLERIATGGRKPVFRSGFLTDLLHSFINPVVAVPVAGVLLSTWQLVTAGINDWSSAGMARLPWWGQLLLALVVGDLIGYWRHRLLHKAFAWPFHAVHHSSETMDWLSNDRVEIGESIVTTTCATAGLFLLGFGPEIALLEMLIRRSYGIYLHAQVPWGYGWLGQVFASPRFHRWHHSADPRARDKNFATLLSCLDRLFGTFFLPPDEQPGRLGLIHGSLPGDYWGQVTHPFRTTWHRLTSDLGSREGGGGREQGGVREQGGGREPGGGRERESPGPVAPHAWENLDRDG